MAAVGIAACARETDKPAEPPPAADYTPGFFNAAEWAFIVAASDRLIPPDNIGPSASQAGVPEFIDRHMQTPYASGDIWDMQGPFLEAAAQFGGKAFAGWPSICAAMPAMASATGGDRCADERRGGA
jgi:gluconate 2-dehydrogenase gamma chain